MIRGELCPAGLNEGKGKAGALGLSCYLNGKDNSSTEHKGTAGNQHGGPCEPLAAATPGRPILIKTVHFLLLANLILKTRVPNNSPIRH